MALTTEERSDLLEKKKTKNKVEFARMRRNFPDRITIVSEGDSWFAYPPKWIYIGTKPSNLIDHLSSFTRGKANFLSLASNGDEAVDMVSGKQKHDLIKILRWHHDGKNRKPVDLLLFSGGGNDVVGKNDFERFLNSAADNPVTAADWVNSASLERKTTQIGLAYHELLDIRDYYSPETLIITHTYDYPYPSLTGGRFLGGLVKTKSWMKPYMDDAGIDNALQDDVIMIFMNAMANEIVQIEDEREGIIVVDSRGTLTDKDEWLNEIHPTSDGFKKIANLIYSSMQNAFPILRE